MVQAIKATKLKKAKKPKKIKLKRSNKKGKSSAFVPVAPPPPAQIFNLGNQRTVLGSSAFNVSHYLSYYEAVTQRRQLLQQAVQKRTTPNQLNATQLDFLNQHGGPNNSAWQYQSTWLINAAVGQFDTTERRRLNIPNNLPLNESTYQKALAAYNRVTDKSLIGTIVEKIQNFSAPLTQLVQTFGAATSGVIKQLIDGLQQVVAAFFPNQLKTMDIRQGYIGDCYLLAGINALGEHGDPQTQAMLRNAVQFNDDGTINVSFAGLGVQDWDANGNPIYTNYTVTPQALQWFEQQDGFSRGNSPLGVRAIEVAYAMHRAGLTRLDTQAQRVQAHSALSAGYLDEGIEALTGMPSEYITTSGLTQAQLAAKLTQPGVQAITAGTSPNPVSPLVPSHAYTITAYNAARHVVTVENPWQTSQPFEISANAFANYSVTVKA
jgi:hypothetical protein